MCRSKKSAFNDEDFLCADDSVQPYDHEVESIEKAIAIAKARQEAEIQQIVAHRNSPHSNHVSAHSQAGAAHVGMGGHGKGTAKPGQIGITPRGFYLVSSNSGGQSGSKGITGLSVKQGGGVKGALVQEDLLGKSKGSSYKAPYHDGVRESVDHNNMSNDGVSDNDNDTDCTCPNDGSTVLSGSDAASGVASEHTDST